MSNQQHDELSEEFRMFLEPLAKVNPNDPAAIARFLATELLKMRMQLQWIQNEVESISSSIRRDSSSQESRNSEPSKP